MGQVINDLPQEELWRDPEGSARAVGLRYVHDGVPGIRRRRCGRGFVYLERGGSVIRDPLKLKRIRSLAIPPAWTEVWISPSARGHLQATGRDGRGRKQYLYHPDWADYRNEVKFARILQFADALVPLRRRIAADLGRRGLPREKVIATVVRLLEKSLIRVGNENYLRENNSFGLTTLRRDHVEVETCEIHFAFRGKSGQWHEKSVRDRRVARVLRQILDLPGQELFCYMNGSGELRTVASEDVNSYLREASGGDFTAKDIRTWHATVAAAAELREIGPAATRSQVKKNISRAVREVARLLGNRPAASRQYYIHPAVLEAYGEGVLLPALETIAAGIDGSFPPELETTETAIKTFLEWRREQNASAQH
jgi:DNA topoisomerase I